jgi:hypothetical protein
VTEPAQPRRPARAPGDERWAQVIKELSRTRGARFILGALLRAVGEAKQDGDTLSISFRQDSMEERVVNELADPRGRSPIETAVENAYGVKLKVVIAGRDSNGAAKKTTTAMDSHIVRAAVTMGARIVDEGNAGGTTPAKVEPSDESVPEPDTDQSG